MSSNLLLGLDCEHGSIQCVMEETDGAVVVT